MRHESTGYFWINTNTLTYSKLMVLSFQQSTWRRSCWPEIAQSTHIVWMGELVHITLQSERCLVGRSKIWCKDIFFDGITYKSWCNFGFNFWNFSILVATLDSLENDAKERMRTLATLYLTEKKTLRLKDIMLVLEDVNLANLKVQDTRHVVY